LFYIGFIRLRSEESDDKNRTPKETDTTPFMINVSIPYGTLALAVPIGTRYCLHVAAYQQPGLTARVSWRISALHPTAGAFFMPAVRVMAAVRGAPSGAPGANFPGPSTRAQLPP
jgi:hypothetical protein